MIFILKLSFKIQYYIFYTCECMCVCVCKLREFVNLGILRSYCNVQIIVVMDYIAEYLLRL